jgi:hypothetical protein
MERGCSKYILPRNYAFQRGRVNTKQSKDFLAEQTVEQAALEGIPLADVEKRMLYFTESDSTSCDNPIELNDEFETQCETKEYEMKISRLLHHAYRRLKDENPEQVRIWDQAIRTLRKGDHYLLVMVDQSSTADLAWWMPILWGFGISVVIFILIVVETSLDRRGLIPSWVFGWISSDRQTQKFQFSLIISGTIGIWFIVKLARLGALGDVAKTLLNSLLSTFSFLRLKGRSRR